PNTGGGNKKKKKPPKKPEKPKNITYESEIHEKLKAIPSFKLEQIYYSLCSIDLENHTPLLSVGAWSFLESLTAKAGRNSTTDFHSFLSKEKLQGMGISDGQNMKSLRQAVERISGYGNTTKHHENSANFNGAQLVNDMDSLKEVICKLAESTKKSGT
ncbi:MAG: hypothetical protein WCD70_17010, partial [Alphaproteobacteria bacterium]